MDSFMDSFMVRTKITLCVLFMVFLSVGVLISSITEKKPTISSFSGIKGLLIYTNCFLSFK